MCTSLCLQLPDGGHLFGRTLDLDAHFGEGVVLSPRGYPFGSHARQYAMLGMASVVGGYPLYADAMNEHGLSMAGLRFSGNAVYAEENSLSDKRDLAPWELIPYVLGHAASISEARELLEGIRLVRRDFRTDIPCAALHWHISDTRRGGSLVVESTAEGLRVYDDVAHVLTNNPPYPLQLARFAACAAPSNTPLPLAAAVHTAHVGEALGAELSSLGESGVGLPGDYSSTSRFIRAAYLARWCDEVGGGSVAEFFRIMGAVAPTAGAVTASGGSHRTLYTVCMDGRAGKYYGKFEEELSVWSVGFDGVDLDADILVTLTSHR